MGPIMVVQNPGGERAEDSDTRMPGRREAREAVWLTGNRFA
jgi:hypothetical protein